MVACHARYRRDRSTRWRRCFLRCVDSLCSVCVSSYASASRPRYDPPPSALQPPPLVQGLVFCPSAGMAALSSFVASLSISSRVRFRFQLFVREDRPEKTETRSSQERPETRRSSLVHTGKKVFVCSSIIRSAVSPSRHRPSPVPHTHTTRTPHCLPHTPRVRRPAV